MMIGGRLHSGHTVTVNGVTFYSTHFAVAEEKEMHVCFYPQVTHMDCNYISWPKAKYVYLYLQREKMLCSPVFTMGDPETGLDKPHSEFSLSSHSKTPNYLLKKGKPLPFPSFLPSSLPLSP